jgi:hypothetical protein
LSPLPDCERIHLADGWKIVKGLMPFPKDGGGLEQKYGMLLARRSGAGWRVHTTVLTPRDPRVIKISTQ